MEPRAFTRKQPTTLINADKLALRKTLVIAAGIAVMLICIADRGSALASGSTDTRVSGKSAAVLRPETQRPVVEECAAPIVVGRNGAVATLFCDHQKKINVIAWDHFVPAQSELMKLGRRATWRQVEVASCTAAFGTPYPAILDIYDLSSKYNGWRFGTGYQQASQLDKNAICGSR